MESSVPCERIAGWAGRRPQLSLFAGSLALAVVFTTWLCLQRPNFLSGYDYVRMHAYYEAYLRAGLLKGHFPLWNPYVGLGRPFLADIETQTLYPPNWLIVPFGVTGGVLASLVLHQTLAIFGGANLGRTLGASMGPSVLLGMGFALASPFTARLATGMVPVYCTLCWWPTLLWLGCLLQDGWNRRLGALFAAVVTLSILAGNPPILYVEALGLCVFLVLRVSWPACRAGWTSVAGNHLGLAACGLLGIAVASVQLLPFYELLGMGNRPFHNSGFALANGMPPASWLSFFYPTSTAFGPNWEYDLYCGLVPLFAATGAIFIARDRQVRALIGLGLVGALLAAGDRTPLLAGLVHVVPGAAALRIPARYGILAATSVLSLAAVVLSRRPRLLVVTATAALVVCGCWLTWLRPYAAQTAGKAPLFYVYHLAPMAVAVIAIGAWLYREKSAQLAYFAGVVLAGFVVADWLWAIRLLSPVYSHYGYVTGEEQIRSFLASDGLLAPGAPPTRISSDSADICENAGMTVGFSSYSSYANPAIDRV